MPPLEHWLEAQYRRSAAGMLMSVSPVGLVQARPGFGQRVRAIRGAIVASPVLASWDPDPDYFFHWFRDSAIVVDALRLLYADGSLGAQALVHLDDFVRFSLGLLQLDGAALVADASWRARVAPPFVRYLRSDAELAAVRGAAVSAEVRVNPDATLDISRWSRPQHDGPAMRALALLRWLHAPAAAGLDGGTQARIAQLVHADLAFVLGHWQRPAFDMWEEEEGLHYYTLRLAAGALAQGAAWLQARGDASRAQDCLAQSQRILHELDGYWLAGEGHYRSRVPAQGARSDKELDIAVVLAAIHAPTGARHSPADPRMHATLARLEALFDAQYPINHDRAPGRGPAMGRYAGDAYFCGGAYYFSTLGAAEFCFRAARHGGEAAAWLARGDAYLETVRAYTPADGALSEQFDGRSGEQASARHLAWSYAAFISCVAARRELARSG
jgi:glucoamylase